jgi:hypothetical protein
MQRAFDFELVRFELAVGQVRLLMRTVIMERIHVLSDSVKPDRLAVRDELTHPTVGNLVELRNRHEIRHG